MDENVWKYLEKGDESKLRLKSFEEIDGIVEAYQKYVAVGKQQEFFNKVKAIADYSAEQNQLIKDSMKDYFLLIQFLIKKIQIPSEKIQFQYKIIQFYLSVLPYLYKYITITQQPTIQHKS